LGAAPLDVLTLKDFYVMRLPRLVLSAIISAAVLLTACSASYAAPSVSDALKLAPVQKGVVYDNPSEDEAKACKINAEKIGGATAWVVRGADGVVLRQFLDSNKDNVVDTWSYFRSGLEVYRDVDADHNGKADQYRWFHTAGSRWATDSNEDGAIDAWKSLSAEEASEEVIAALRNKDAKRFQRLLLTKEEAAELGLAKPMAEELGERLAAAPKAFAKLADEGKLDAKAEFTDFGGLRPGAIPAGTRGAEKDLLVYEDAWAMVLSGGQHLQMQLGSMVLVDGVWKLVDGPALGANNPALAGFFFGIEGAPPTGAGASAATTAINEPTAAMQKILESIEKLDAEMASAEADKMPALTAKRADLLEELAAAAATPEERVMWYKQVADAISSAAQDGSYPDGLKRLDELEAKLAKEKVSEELLTHIEFRRMVAAHWLKNADPKTDYAEAQKEWLQQLEAFVAKHKGSEHVAEALYQLGMHSEYGGDEEAAQKWYQRLATDFPKSPTTPKARGAIRRLTSAGKPLELKGPDVSGASVDLAQYRGKNVLVHYWSTSSPVSQADHEMLVDIYKKFGGAKFDIIGVSLDYSRDELVEYLKANPQLRWKQIFEPGGFENRLATEMGVITSPLMVLVDDKGQVVSANLQAVEVAEQLEKLLDERVAKAK
jgi:peroxiredoxin